MIRNKQIPSHAAKTNHNRSTLEWRQFYKILNHHSPKIHKTATSWLKKFPHLLGRQATGVLEDNEEGLVIDGEALVGVAQVQGGFGRQERFYFIRGRQSRPAKTIRIEPYRKQGGHPGRDVNGFVA